MLKVMRSIAELHLEQLLSVYAGSNKGDDWERSFLSYLREDFFQKKNACYCVWTVEGVYRSVLRLEPYRDGLLLQAVETAPAARKRGYGFALVKGALEYFSNTNYKCIYSHINKRNIPSLKLHKKCGFQEVSDSAVLLDGTVTTNFCTLYYKY